MGSWVATRHREGLVGSGGPQDAQAQEEEEVGSEVGVTYYCHMWKKRHSLVPLP